METSSVLNGHKYSLSSAATGKFHATQQNRCFILCLSQSIELLIAESNTYVGLALCKPVLFCSCHWLVCVNRDCKYTCFLKLNYANTLVWLFGFHIQLLWLLFRGLVGASTCVCSSHFSIKGRPTWLLMYFQCDMLPGLTGKILQYTSVYWVPWVNKPQTTVL